MKGSYMRIFLPVLTQTASTHSFIIFFGLVSVAILSFTFLGFALYVNIQARKNEPPED